MVAKWLSDQLVVMAYIRSYPFRVNLPAPFPWTCESEIAGADLRRPIGKQEVYKGVKSLISFEAT